MPDNLIDRIERTVAAANASFDVGQVTRVAGGMIQVRGMDRRTKIGDRAKIYTSCAQIPGQVIRLEGPVVELLAEGAAEGVSIGDKVVFTDQPVFAPDEDWIGRVVNPDGLPIDGKPLLPGRFARKLRVSPPAPHTRRPLGARLETGHAVFNTILPIVEGQRIGLFAGSGVGKSTLLANLATGVMADVVVIGLVGERGRELRHFIQDVLGAEGMARAVVVAATSDEAPQVRRDCALAAMTVAEHFRDQGKQVLLLIDSITRFCEAHREVALAAGEPASLRGFPASTGPAIAALCERAGPGEVGSGDITAIFSVLVAGSDMEEPVADMLRGVLDGHVILEREIAERGRFPAINILKSVSRSLPAAASPQENAMIAQARAILGTYDKAELMIQSGLYTLGSDPSIDTAIACEGKLDEFLSIKDSRGTLAHFAKLRQAINASAGRMTGENLKGTSVE